MRKVSFLIALLTLPLSTFSQSVNNKEIDSLSSTLKNKNTIEKVDIYNKLISLTMKTDSKQARIYNDKILKISEENKYEKGVTYFHYNSLNLMSRNEDPDAFIKHAVIATNGFRESNDTVNFIKSTQQLCTIYAIIEDIEKAENVLKTAEEFLGMAKNGARGAALYIMYSDINREKGNFVLAIEYLEKALKYYIAADNAQALQVCYNRMCTLSLRTGDWKDAEKYAMMCLEIQKTLKISSLSNYLQMLSLASEIEIKLKKYSEAKKYLKLAIKIAKENKFDASVAENLKNLAKIHYIFEEYTECIKVGESALKYKYVMGSNYINADVYNILRMSYLNLNNLKMVRHYTNLMLNIKKEDVFKKNINDLLTVNLYRDTAKTEIALGNYKKAYEYSEKASTIEREWLLKEKDSRVNEFQAKFDVANKNIQLKDLTIEKQKNMQKITNQRNSLFVGGSIFIIVLILSAMLLSAYITKIKNNRTLKSKNQIIETSIKERDLLLREIHHRVKNNLQLVISLLNIQARENKHEIIETFLDKGRSRIISMALIHENIYQAENLTKVDFQEYLNKLVNAVSNSFQFVGNKITFEVLALKMYFDIQTSIPLGLIINELICNAMKHAFINSESGKIIITISKNENDSFNLYFSDDGSGIKSNANEKSFGLELVKLLTLQLNGGITIDSIGGTHYNITFEDKAIL